MNGLSKVNQKLFGEACEVTRGRLKISEYLSKEKLTYDLSNQDEAMIRCPFPDHNDSKPSFSYNDTKQIFNCFGCERGGDVVDLHFHMRKIEDERYSRIKAVLELSRKYKIVIPDLFNETMTTGKVNKFKRVVVDKDKLSNEFFMEKVNGLEQKVRNLPIDRRIEVYRLVDDMCYEKMKPKEVFNRIRKEIQRS